MVKEKLVVYHDSNLVIEYPYPLPKSFILLSKIDLLNSDCLDILILLGVHDY